MTAGVWVAVAGLGGAAAILRFLLDGLIARRLSSRLPLGTLAVNLSGAFLLGLLTGAAVLGTAFVLAGSAILGSYTTFSTWMLESQRLAEDGELGWALANVIVSVVAGVAAAALGATIGARA